MKPKGNTKRREERKRCFLKAMTKRFIEVIIIETSTLAIEIAEKVREFVSCSVFYGKPGKALDYANSYGIGKVIFIGDKEVKKNKFKVKDMDSGKEKFISEKNLDSEFKKY